MRNYLAKNLRKGYWLHAAMWGDRFPMHKSIKVVDFGLAEQALVNAAAGLYLNDENVYIYGVAGFIIHQMEQMKYSLRQMTKVYPNKKGRVIIFNAGKVGYEVFTAPHRLVDDKQLMEHYKIKVFNPNTIEELKNALKEIEDNDIKLSYVRLGKDFNGTN